MIVNDVALGLPRACSVARRDKAVEAVKELPQCERAFYCSTARKVVTEGLPCGQRLIARNVFDRAPPTNLLVRAGNVAVEERLLALRNVAEAGKLFHRRTPAFTHTWPSSMRVPLGTFRRRFVGT
jgi:hypothetical protein